jgi:DNA mismatch repair ATPase MutS
MNKDSNVLFLTGANMAGKSTLMKSIGINLYLAHMGFPVAVETMEFSVREGLYSSINIADNIGLGYSHFYAEVVRVKQAAEAAASGKRLLLMFDELFKGTNVKDAYDGTLAVTEGFADYRKCLFIVSTHIIEVGQTLKEQGNIQFVYMPTVLDGPHPRYTYRLREGITEDRQGMMIIRNEGILELLNQTALSGYHDHYGK